MDPRLYMHGGLHNGLPSGLISSNLLKLWLEGSRTPIGGVPSWADISGNRNNPIQGTEGKQPDSVASQQNGRSAIVFDGSASNTLVLSSYNDIKAIPSGNSAAFIVSKRTSEDGSLDQIFAMSESGSLRYAITYSATAGTITFQSRDANGSAVSSTGNTNTDFQIIRCRREGTTQAIAVNGGAEVTNTSGADESGVTNVQIGSFQDSGNYLNGSIAEILLFNRSPTPSEIRIVESYLSYKWAIPLI